MERVTVQSKRPRGRPVGTGKADNEDLARIADLLVVNPSLKPTTAAKKLHRNIDGTHLRRLQVKWKAQSNTLLAEAAFRAAMKKAPPRVRVEPSPEVHMSAAKGAASYVQIRALEDGIFKLARDISRMQAIYGIPALQSIVGLNDHPALKGHRRFSTARK